jgi:hypothetical protein
MNYETASDFEINKAVAEALGHELTQFSHIKVGRQWCIKEPVGDDWVPQKIPNYCEDWNEAGPIILKNMISLKDTLSGPYWKAEKEIDDGEAQYTIAEFVSDEPLRAAMIVYLKMQASELRKGL